MHVEARSINEIYPISLRRPSRKEMGIAYQSVLFVVSWLSGSGVKEQATLRL